MQKYNFLKFSLLISILFISTVAIAKDIEIKCSDPEQCKRKFIAIGEWIKINSLLPIVESKNNFDNGLLVTEKSNSPGFVIYNGDRLSRKIAKDFVVEIIDGSSIKIKMDCASFFGCFPWNSTEDVIGKYADDREQVILQQQERINNAVKEAYIKEYNDRLSFQAWQLSQLDRVKRMELEGPKPPTEFQKKIIEFRSQIKLGDESHCGMIIEVKQPLVKIQSIIGERWFKIEQIYPAHGAPCNFVNNKYQSLGSDYGIN